MDEEQNNMEEQQKNNIENKIKDQVKDIGRNGIKAFGKKIGQAAIKLVASAISAIGPYLIVAIIIAQLFLSLTKWVVDNYVSDTTSEKAASMIDTYCTIDEDGIHFKKEEMLKALEEEFLAGGIDLHDLGFGDMNNRSQATEYLYNFMTASMISEFPYIEGSDEEAKGIIYIKRNENGSLQDLEYIGYKKFTEMLESQDRKIKEKSKQYFSLDESWNLCISKAYRVTVNGEETEYNISEVKIPYRTMVSQYTLPFEFLINLQSIAQSANYVQAVADLVRKSSNIELTIFDSITTNTEVYTYRHSIMRKWVEHQGAQYDETGTNVISGSRDIPRTSGPDKQPDQVTTTVTQTDAIKANVTRAKTWILDQEINYKSIAKPTEYPLGEEGQTVTIPDEPEPEGDTGTWKVDQSETTVISVNENEWQAEGTKSKLSPSQFFGLWKNDTGRYVEGALYKKDGIEVKYKLPQGTYENDNPRINIFGAEEWFCTLLENNQKTQLHAELMRYLIHLYELYEEGKEDDGSINIDLSIFEPTEFVEGSYQGDFDVHDASAFITDINILKQAFKGGYSKSEKLIENAQAFLDMQNTYQVNALFAAAVSITETSAGRAGHAIDGKNNWFNIRNGGNGWASYDSSAAGIKAFGNLIANGTYYYKQGKYTVGAIGQTYCPNTPQYPTQADGWIANTKAQIARFYSAAGIDSNAFMTGGGPGAGGVSGAAGDGYRGKYTTGSGKTYVEYLQYSGPWWNNPYMGGNMKNSGCSVTSVGLILSGFGIDKNPEDIRRINPNGVSLKSVISSYGLKCVEDYNATASKVLSHLNTGNPVIINAGHGYWSNGSGHYFAVLEANGNQVYVSNVGSSTKTGWYDINTVLLQNKKVLFISR